MRSSAAPPRTQFSFVEQVERTQGRIQVAVQVVRIGGDVEQAGDDFADRLSLVQVVHRGDPVVDVELGVPGAQAQHAAVVLQHVRHRPGWKFPVISCACGTKSTRLTDSLCSRT
jgi:hypothetical protein